LNQVVKEPQHRQMLLEGGEGRGSQSKGLGGRKEQPGGKKKIKKKGKWSSKVPTREGGKRLGGVGLQWIDKSLSESRYPDRKKTSESYGAILFNDGKDKRRKGR